jgi:predicted ester cyclase
MAAFPDLRWVGEVVLAAGAVVVWRGALTGTHLGTFLGVAATGRAIRVPAVYIAEVTDAMVTSGWLMWDRLGLFQQLGVLPPTTDILRRSTA